MPQQAQIKISTSTHTLLGNPRMKITGKAISPASIRENCRNPPAFSRFLQLYGRESMWTYIGL